MQSSSPFDAIVLPPSWAVRKAVREEIPPAAQPAGTLAATTPTKKFTFVLESDVSRQLDILVTVRGGDRSTYVNRLLKQSLAHIPIDLISQQL